jgi:hypothetical protein
MITKKPPQKPTNLRPYDCNLTVNNQRLTQLEISPYYEKHNEEYLAALGEKSIKLSAKELAEKLITDDLIRKILLPQLDGEKEVRIDGVYYHYTYYHAVPLYKKNKAYKLVWCLSNKEPNTLGIMDCFRIEKYDILTERKSQ